ncbi:type IX secretion system membrane protein PorP/SprF [uncultured Croceitalea sp.]|uniref:PorP/SprF family type IX secretion system membrane protein n=1 Tax=uncultured Croceitalea sp. TaxID=1798908 RepID=UPI003306080A
MKALHTYALLFALFVTTISSAQQLPQFTQYMFNTISVNPAYAGSRETMSLTALHRNQWAGLDGNPVTSTFSFHTPLKNERIGLGLSYITDQLGFESTNFVYGDFSYSIPVSWEAKLSFGLKAGYTNYNKDDIDPNDPAETNVSEWKPNFGAGIYLSTNRWYAGISSPRILQTTTEEAEFEALERNSYYALAGLVFDLSLDIKFRPSVITKFTNGAPATYDLTSGFLFYEKFWAGVSYRFNDASNFGAYMDYQISKDIRVGYAYDLPTGDLRPYTGGTHEVILIFEPRLTKKTDLYKSPRYF